MKTSSEQAGRPDDNPSRACLQRWLQEWQVDRLLQEDLAQPPDSGTGGRADDDQSNPAPAVGQIRLLHPRYLPDGAGPLYLALIAARPPAGFTAAPFSRFSVPALDSELQTERQTPCLRVVSPGIARPLRNTLLNDSWFVDTLTPTELEEMHAVFRHAFHRADLSPHLAARTGPPLVHPDDPRHVYAEEEAERMDTLWSRCTDTPYTVDGGAEYAFPRARPSMLRAAEPGSSYETGPDGHAAQSDRAGSVLPDAITTEAATYRRELVDNILPFWMRYARDRECGGYVTCLNRDGSVYDFDKLCMWAPGRIIWTFSHAYNALEPRKEWLDMAQAGVEFVRAHGFAPDGSMYYALTRQGAPLQPAQDVFTELSTVLGFTEYARATDDAELHREARRIFDSVWTRFSDPGHAFQPVLAQTRPARLHGHSMITLNVIQELRRFDPRPEDDKRIAECIRIMLDLHARPQRRAVLELVDWDGAELPGHLGRWINPGHMIEGGIFLIHEGRQQAHDEWVRAGLNWIDWGFEHGWDKEFGGICNDVDLDGLPVPTVLTALRYDAKLWWQHAEALYALLLAYVVTGDARLFEKYRMVRDYSFARFADPACGEWIAALDRRGNPINQAKGTDRKSAFHIGRNFLLCALLAEDGGPA